MNDDLERLQLKVVTMQEEIDKRGNQLFNAFSIYQPEVLRKEPPYDFEYMRSIAEAFYKYLNQLDEMGKHELYAG